MEMFETPPFQQSYVLRKMLVHKHTSGKETRFSASMCSYRKPKEKAISAQSSSETGRETLEVKTRKAFEDCNTKRQGM